MSEHIALLCTLHPASQEKQDRCISLLRAGARGYYRQLSAKCTTWSYCLPYPPPKSSTQNLTVTGLEIYSSKAALQAQVDDQEFFQAYHETVKREGLYAEPEELVAWGLEAGFVSRREGREEGGGVLVSVTRLGCRDRDAVVGALREFSQWVHASEPGVLTYAVFTRPKAKDEVLIYVRYQDGKVMRSHDQAPEHQNVGKLMGPYLVLKKTSTTIWREVGDSFVSHSGLSETGQTSGSTANTSKL